MHDDEYRNESAIGRFFKALLRWVRGYFMAIGLLVTLFPLILWFVLNQAASRQTTARVPQIGADERVMIKVDLEGTLLETSPDFSDTFLQRLLGEARGFDIPRLEVAMRRATNDKRVRGVFVHMRGTSGSPAAYAAARRALALFKASGRPVSVHLSTGSTYDYYLASVGEEVALTKAGGLTMLEPAFQLVYVSEALKKLGIEFDVVKAGRYKSALEPLVATHPSEPTIEMYQTIEESLRTHIATTIAADRKKPEAEVRGWLKSSLFTGVEAKSQGLVDVLGYPLDVQQAFGTRLDTETVMSVKDYVAATESLDAPITESVGASLAYIEAVGNIMDDSAQATRTDITPKPLIRELRWAANEPNVKAVVIRVVSPGGSALASDLIAEEVRRLKEKKPVVISMGEVAASGGYYIAAPASRILAEPTTITGSIGVIAALPKGLSFQEKWGVNFHVISQSERSALMNFGKPMTPADKRVLETQIDDVYETFVRTVAEGRGIPEETVRSIAEGRVYTGAQALDLKLVDQLGGLRDAYQEAKKLASLDPNKLYPIDQYEGPPTSIWECLGNPGDLVSCLGELSQDSGIVAPMFEDERLEHLQTLKRLFGERRILALWTQGALAPMAR